MDGEACLRIRKQKRHYSKDVSYHSAMLEIAMTSLEALERAKAVSGFGNVAVLRKPTVNSKKIYRWTVWGQKAVELIRQTMPYLIVKRTQAELLCKLGDSIAMGVRPVPPAEQSYRDRLMIECSSANQGRYSGDPDLNDLG
jgi:hypothetical protein